jgi:predicted ATPase
MADSHVKFVGRRRELAEIGILVRHKRLVTLTGTGGVGKTQLALRVAARVRARFPDGVSLVELAGLTDGDDPAAAVTRALGLHEAVLGLQQARHGAEGMLIEYLARKRMLLVLDGCEQTVDACAWLVRRLLNAAPGLCVLTTSQHVLGLFGEHVRVVEPLPLPPADRPVPLQELRRYEAVSLFVARARAAASGFDLTAQNCQSVLQLCRRLDGIPLAIELAAALLRSMPLETVLDQSGQIGKQPLRETLHESFALCSPAQRLLWARLSVFTGGFGLDAAEEVGAGGDIDRNDVFRLVAELVDRSVLTLQGRRHRARYRMLEPTRQYGEDVLIKARQQDALRQRHCAYYLRLIKRVESDWMSPRQLDWFTLLYAECDNFRAAMRFCFSRQGWARVGQDIAAGLARYWFVGGGLTEGRHWLRRSRSPAGPANPDSATALWIEGWLAILQGNSTEGLRLLDRARTVARQVDDHEASRRVIQFSGLAALFDARYADAFVLFQDALSRHREAGDLDGVWLALYQLALAASHLGDTDRALAYSEECLDLCERYQARWSQSYAWWVTATVRWRRGDADALPLLRESLRLRHAYHDVWGTVLCLEVMAWIAGDSGDSDRAGLLLGGARRLWRSVASEPERIEFLATAHRRCEQQTRAALGDEAFAGTLKRGAQLTTEQTVRIALDRSPRTASRTEVVGRHR